AAGDAPAPRARGSSPGPRRPWASQGPRAPAERNSPAVEPATQWPFTRERWRTLGPSSAADEAPLAASTTKMPLAVPMIAVLMPHLRGCPCAASGATIGPAGAVVKEQRARQGGVQ